MLALFIRLTLAIAQPLGDEAWTVELNRAKHTADAQTNGWPERLCLRRQTLDRSNAADLATCHLTAEAHAREVAETAVRMAWQERVMGFGVNDANTRDNLRVSRSFYVQPTVSDSVAAARQRALLEDSRARCDDVGACVCVHSGGSDEVDASLIFDGRKCVQRAASGWGGAGGSLDASTATLTAKWTVVPAGLESYNWGTLNVRGGLLDTARIAKDLPLHPENERELARVWREAAAIDTFSQFYASTFRGKRLLDIGSGFARQTMSFALHGAFVTFVDIAPTNLALLKRVATALGIPSTRVRFVQLTGLKQLGAALTEEPALFDVVCAFGSMHHAPREVIREEMAVILPHLRVGGKWLQLAYNQDEWLRRGAPPFSGGGWGGDGDNTPWTEWYASSKLLRTLEPSKFAVVWEGLTVGQFTWHDLLKIA